MAERLKMPSKDNSMKKAGRVTEKELKFFSNTICKACSFCGEDLEHPLFCYKMYIEDKSRFLKMIKHLRAELDRDKKEATKTYSSFEGFCGLFCNSDICPLYTKRCTYIAPRIYCYEMFASQWDPSPLQDEIKRSITTHFRTKILCNVGVDYCASPDPFRGMKKGTKRKIKKAISKAHKQMAAAMKTNSFDIKPKATHIPAKKSKIKTSIFYNDDDKEWEEEISRVLGGL